MAIANLTIRFLVELVGIAAFGYWGLQSGGPGRRRRRGGRRDR